MRSVIPWWVLLVVPPTTASAQRFAQYPPAPANTSALSVIVHGRSVETRGVKSEATASWMSVSATFLPVAVGVALLDGESVALPTFFIVSGLVVGPSVGHFYIGRPGGVLLRFGVGATTTGVAFAAGSSAGGWDGLTAFLGVMAAGTAIILVDGLYDIARVGGAVRKYNARRSSRTPIAHPAVYLALGRVVFGMRLEF